MVTVHRCCRAPAASSAPKAEAALLCLLGWCRRRVLLLGIQHVLVGQALVPAAPVEQLPQGCLHALHDQRDAGRQQS